MSNDPVEPGEGANDLLGRWLAHHDNPADEGHAPPRRVKTAAHPGETGAHRLTRPSASAALAEVRYTPAAAPSALGAHRGLPGTAPTGPVGPPRRGAQGEVAERDRPSPVGFEPVILRSVRKKSEPIDEPEKRDKRGRLSRLRSRSATPDQAPPVLTALPPAPPADPPRKLVPYEEVIALATTASLPRPATATTTTPSTQSAPSTPSTGTETGGAARGRLSRLRSRSATPDQAPPVLTAEPPAIALATTASFPAAEPEVEVEVVPSGPAARLPGPGAVEVGKRTKRRRAARAKRPEADVPEERTRRLRVPRTATAPSTGTGTGGAARGLLAAARAATPVPAPTAQTPPAPKKPEPVPTPPVEPVAKAPVPSTTPMEMPAVYAFATRKSARRFLSLMLIAGLVASGYLGYTAYLSRDSMAIGIAAIVTVATLVIWAIRAGATVTQLTVKSGQLEIKRQGGRMVFDLASTYTSIEVTGKPGSKKWRVMFLRRGMSPVVVDSTMVDGRDFMRILRFFRPELA